MPCKFNDKKECIHSDLFEKWKEDTKEIAWLTLGICPTCPLYLEDLEEVTE